jgi:hypothetical protein
METSNFTDGASLPSIAWDTEKIKYSGHGKAFFSDSNAVIEGEATIEVDELGNQSIVLIADKLFINSIPQKNDWFNFAAVIQGTPIQKTSQGLVLPIMGINRGKCTSLIVETETGIFSSCTEISSISFDNRESFRITFDCLSSEFKKHSNISPKYMRIALTNFLCKDLLYSFEFKDHHLRIEQKENESDIDFLRKNCSIPFTISQFQWFIIGSLNYSLFEKEIVEGRRKYCLTSFAVGEIPDSFFDYHDFKQISRFSGVLANLLSFIVGNNVGSPWIEFLSQEGEVLKRVHVSNNKIPYQSGRNIFSSVIRTSASTFLKNAFDFKDILGNDINVYIRRLVELNQSGTLDRKMTLIASTFESVLKEYSIGRVRLLDQIGPLEKQKVNEILKDSSNKIRGLISKNPSNHNQKKFLERIADRVLNSSNIEDSFGISVSQLVDYFGFEDGKILDTYYDQTHKRSKDSSWSMTLSLFRRTVVHGEYFNFSESNLEVDEVWNILRHLHDLLVRILFKKINFFDPYQPLVSIYLVTDKNIDWVNQNTRIEELGFEMK